MYHTYTVLNARVVVSCIAFFCFRIFLLVPPQLCTRISRSAGCRSRLCLKRNDSRIYQYSSIYRLIYFVRFVSFSFLSSTFDEIIQAMRKKNNKDLRHMSKMELEVRRQKAAAARKTMQVRRISRNCVGLATRSARAALLSCHGSFVCLPNADQPGVETPVRVTMNSRRTQTPRPQGPGGSDLAFPRWVEGPDIHNARSNGIFSVTYGQV